jgi:uncharacterized protein YfaS (alpha-2-macroglobulin family)
VTIVNTGNQPTEVKVSVTGIPAVPPPAAATASPSSAPTTCPTARPSRTCREVQQNDRFVVTLTLTHDHAGLGPVRRCRSAARRLRDREFRSHAGAASAI